MTVCSLHAALLLLSLVPACNPNDMTARLPAADGRRARRTPAPELDAGERCPAFDAEYRDDFKVCELDAECDLVAIQIDCEGTRKLYGLAGASLNEFERCAPDANSFHACVGEPAPTRAEDGRTSVRSDHSDVHARCVDRRCQSRVEERECGDAGKVCRANELCVAYQSASGTLEFECAANPCTSQLDCECAQPVCSVHTDQPRSCAVDAVSTSDVFCKTVRF